ncbi:MAG: hypothetical protein ABW360_12045, partial [Phenylobacterium sp.]
MSAAPSFFEPRSEPVLLTGRTLRAQALACAAIAALISGAAQAADAPGVAHPGLWPAARSPGLVDARTEARVSALMARM